MNKDIDYKLVSPCGLYCGVCAIYIAHMDNNIKLKEKLVSLYRGDTGKGKLPGSEKLKPEDIKCQGCMSEQAFLHCRQCEIKICTKEKEISGCHECDDFPCTHIRNFPMAVGKKVIMRCVPYRKQFGTEKWVLDEEARYHCTKCGQKVFRGAMRCNKCKAELDLD
jgi:hypothetical protein